MVAGRALDALIAEKVMGWTGRFLFRALKNKGDWSIGFQGNGDARGIGNFSRWYRDDGTKLYCGRPHSVYPAPTYSTSIAAAWEVVEKLKADGYTVAVTTSGHEAFAHVMVYRTKPYGDDGELRV